MVIAKSAPAGLAKIVPVLHEINGNDDLRALAEEVALAEGIARPKGARSLACSWGCVAVLPHADHPDVAQDWRGFAIDATSAIASYSGLEAPIDPAGILDSVLWVPSFDPFDLILATVTKPEAATASIDEIAAAMGAPPTGNRGYAYFQGNRRAGIATFQDAEILAALAARGFMP
ncbi:MAG TPA: hypothetical protein VMM27_02980 [Casimicrobiaceae bacterium]|nr:hypothetical protein [Casimicrobiaceae bacterium]